MLSKNTGVILATLILGGCAGTPPPIAMQARDPKTGIWQQFEKYVPKAYPVGSNAHLLDSTLKAQDFVVTNETPGHFRAEYKYTEFVVRCGGPDYDYLVEWSADKAGRIAEIYAEQHRCGGP